MKNQLEQTQSILYLGYILLVVLGIINETFFYSQFNINILEYADILDVLLSPISRLTSNVILLVISILTVLAVIILPKQISKLKSKEWFMKAFKIESSETKIEGKILTVMTVFVVIFFLGIFVGTGWGKAERLKNQIASETVAYNDVINFLDGKSLEVEIVGKNSSYLFYLTPANNYIQISPINGTVKSLSIK